MRSPVCFHRLALAFLLLGAAGPAAAAEVRVLALFEGKAVLEIDGRQQTLAQGETGPGGVRVLRASPSEVTVEIDGRVQRLELGRHIGTRYAAPATREAQILRAGNGAYVARGAINGYPVEFLVDTGASTVSLSGREAERLGLAFRTQGSRIGVATAQGVTSGYQLMLARVQVGELTLNNVEAIVIDGEFPVRPLLGMTFLGRIEMRHEQGLLVLRQNAP